MIFRSKLIHFHPHQRSEFNTSFQLSLALECLDVGGGLLIKFLGLRHALTQQLVLFVRLLFDRVRIEKPYGSRKGSAEVTCWDYELIEEDDGQRAEVGGI